jgi:hypothetical protein
MIRIRMPAQSGAEAAFGFIPMPPGWDQAIESGLGEGIMGI